MSDLYRLVYTSKNLLQGSETEISAAVMQILTTSQRNNDRAGVTGALMFNEGAFAQVLEGPRQGVEMTFERIQRDLRHGEVTVLQCAPVGSRGFPNWSMAFVGHSPRGQMLWRDLANESGFDLARMNGDDVFAMLHGLVLEEEGVPAISLVPSPADRLATPSAGSLDVERVRRELSQLTGEPGTIAEGPGATAARGPAAEKPALAALAIFRAALASERARTTELREELDDLQIALAKAELRANAIEHDRDLWAQRARILVSALNLGAEAVCARTEAAPAKQIGSTPSHTVASRKEAAA